jgi:ferredoxin-NADP reductase
MAFYFIVIYHLVAAIKESAFTDSGDFDFRYLEFEDEREFKEEVGKISDKDLIEMTLKICGREKDENDLIDKLSLGSDLDTIIYEHNGLKSSFFNFMKIFPETFIFSLSKYLSNQTSAIPSLDSRTKSFCLQSFSKFEIILHDSHEKTEEYKKLKKETHGLYMTIAWVYLIPLGIISSRYFKSYGIWFYIHLICSTVSALLNILGYYEIMKDGGHAYEKFKPDKFYHFRIGQLTMSLLTITLVSGLSFSAFKVFTKRTQIIFKLSKFHALLGSSILLFSLFNCYTGWTFVESSYEALFDYGVIFMTLLFIVLETYQRLYKNKDGYQKNNLLITRHLDVFEKIKQGKFLVFADEFVLDVTHFHRSHPGGSFMITGTLGEDMGKYMVGCSSYSGKFNPYEHSLSAFAISRDLAVAQIEFPLKYFVSGINNFEDFEVAIKEKVEIAKDTFLIYLNSDKVKMPKACTNEEFLGKHFLFKANVDGRVVKRYYSCLIVDPLKWAEELGVENRRNEDCGHIKLIFKVYKGGKGSGFLNEMKENNKACLRGPLGPGLLIDRLEGKFVALAGGTGLVPFIDLVHMAWSRNQKTNFEFTLFSFFRDEESAFLVQLLKKVEEKQRRLVQIPSCRFRK